MILMDTSAIYALADRADTNNAKAKEFLRKLTESEEELLVHNYIILESTALLQRRLGARQVKAFLETSFHLSIVWVTKESHTRAVQYFLQNAGRDLSLVDCMSFVVMKENGISKAFAFDEDFEKAGFELYS